MKAIPVGTEPKRYAKAAFINSPFVEIQSGPLFKVAMQYPRLGMEHAEQKAYVRKEVYALLCKAAEKLPKGYRFKIWDAWRPFALQKELYESYSEMIVREFHLEERTPEEREAAVRRFVSEPVLDKNVPPVHTTGGAVDLTLVNAQGAELEMGTAFDAFSDQTNTAYFEKGDDVLIRNNRRLLYHSMISVGFVNLPSEWWHYDYGDRFWGFYNRRPAIYQGVFTREEMNE